MTASNWTNRAMIQEPAPDWRIYKQMSDAKAFLALFSFLAAILILFGVITALF